MIVDSLLLQYSTFECGINTATTPWLKKETSFIFTITSSYVDQFSYFFTVNFRKELRKNKKYHLPLNLLPHWRTTLQKVSVHARGLLVYKGYDSGSYLQVTNAIIGVY